MARNKKSLERRNKALKEYFEYLGTKKAPKGAPLHTYQAKLELTADKFYIEVRTVEDVLYPPNPKSTDDPNQIKLFQPEEAQNPPAKN